MRAIRAVLAAWAIGQGGLADAAEGPAPGHWEGVLRPAPGAELTLVVHVVRGEGGKATATFDSPDQGTVGLPIDAIADDGGELTFAIAGIKGEFRGKLDDGKTEAVGTWTQLGKATPLTLKKTDRPTTLVVPDAILGAWEGKLKAGPGVELRLVLKAARRPDGARVVAFASPDQGAEFLPIDAVALDGAKVTLKSKAIGAEFVGTLDAAGGEIAGTWMQGPARLPLALKKVEKPSRPDRPQTPRPPFPYRSEDVTYPNPSARITLAGTLALPEGAGPFPAALLITGSGAQDRDETLFGHRPFAVIADALARRGIAVLRVDDRGVGKSTGSQADATGADFATDVLAGIAYLKTRPEVDPRRIGLVGHSEGGIIAPMVAAKAPGDVAFLVLLAGTGVNGAEILKAQSSLILKASGLPDGLVAAQGRILAEILKSVAEGKDDPGAADRFDALVKAGVAMLPEADRQALGAMAGSSLKDQFLRVNSPWFRHFLAFEPRTALEKVRCPVLALNGEKDLQVPPGPNLPAIAAALKAGGNERVTTRVLPGLNHLFQPCQTGAPSEYARIATTIDPSVLALMGDWIVATVGPK